MITTTTKRSFSSQRARTPTRSAMPIQLARATASKHAATAIYTLPDDILLLIISFVGVRDILILRQTSKRLYGMTRLRWVWSTAMKRQIIDKGLPIPAASEADLKDISAQHLEARAVHAAKFHENWYSAHPKPRRVIEFEAEASAPSVSTSHQMPTFAVDTVVVPDSLNNKYPVKQVLFLPGRNGEFIVTAVNRSVICWEVPLDGSGAYKRAEWQSDRAIEQIVVNEDPKHAVQLVCVSGDREGPHIARIHLLKLDTFHGSFTECNLVRSLRDFLTPIHAYRGDSIAFGNPLSVWCLGIRGKTLHEPPAIRRIPIHPGSEDTSKVIKARFVDRYLLVVRSQSIQLVEYVSIGEDETVKRLSGHLRMEHPAREATIVVRPSDPTKESPLQCKWPVTVLLRCCDDGFDTIRQYDLLRNPKAGKDPLLDRELPCLFPTQYTRLFRVAPSCCSLQVGRNGKGFWIQTRNVVSRHSEHPARCLMGFDIVKDDQLEHEAELGGQVNGANALHLCKQELYSRRCDMSEILYKKYLLTTADLEDTVGRIAVGDRRGRVEVLDFV